MDFISKIIFSLKQRVRVLPGAAVTMTHPDVRAQIEREFRRLTPGLYIVTDVLARKEFGLDAATLACANPSAFINILIRTLRGEYAAFSFLRILLRHLLPPDEADKILQQCTVDKVPALLKLYCIECRDA